MMSGEADFLRRMGKEHGLSLVLSFKFILKDSNTKKEVFSKLSIIFRIVINYI